MRSCGHCCSGRAIISEVKGIWSAGKLGICREKVRKVEWSEVKGILSAEEVEGLESDKWREENFKWSEDQLNAVKGWKIRRCGMWSVYKGSEVEWGVSFGKIV
jgi:hypothetical protein